jgi:hypothetical protein
MSLFIDHIAILSPSLQQATQQFSKHSGVEAVYGGPHSDGGTHNALAALGDRTYLEIVGPDPKQQHYPTETADWASICRSMTAPRVYAWCVACSDLVGLRETLKSYSIGARGPVPDSRKRPDGVELHWELLLSEQGRFGTAFPFFIDWKKSPHPATSAPGGCRIHEFRVGHPDAKELAKIFAAINLDIETFVNPIPRFAFALETPRGIVRWG